MIGVFDSGFGGLTVLKELRRVLPTYDFLYLGDNARAPYGGRSFETIHRYTREAVRFLFEQGCPLVLLACNTASARALRTIQQVDLPQMAPDHRVLGVLRPVVEEVGLWSQTRQVGIVGTTGTVRSESYPIELARIWPDLQVFQQDCPLWVPLVESGDLESEGTRFFVRKYLRALIEKAPGMDLLVLGCTHYPLLRNMIEEEVPEGVAVLEQGPVVAQKTKEYLVRHPEMDARLSKKGQCQYLTTDTPSFFAEGASRFLGESVQAKQVVLA